MLFSMALALISPRYCPTTQKVTILIYNILGQKVATLLDGKMNPGNYTMKWKGVSDSGKELPSGMYFYEMTSPNFHQIKKLVLVR